MDVSRQAVIVVALAAVVGLTLFILKGLLGTIFFAITVAYILMPLHSRLKRRGVPAWWSAAASTTAAMLFGIGLFVPIALVLYIRRGAALSLLRTLPASVTLSFEGFEYVIVIEEVTTLLARRLTQLAVAIAEGMPVIALKVVVFAFVVFALLYRGDRLRRALEAPLSNAYRADMMRLHARIRETLYSIYIIQAATAVATFVIALIVFVALGVPFPVTLAVIAGLFQFLPVIGPSIVIIGLVIADLLAGDAVGAALIGVIGVVFIGFLPDAVLRPWLAQETTKLSSALYFVGLTGGLLSLGPIGVVAGPLVVVILVELLAMLSEQRPARHEPSQPL